MTKVYAIQTGQTTLEQQSRVESAAGAPLTEEGAISVRTAALELNDLQERGFSAVYACTLGEAEHQTAELVADVLGLKIRNNDALHELDYGLWQGLTVDEIKHRQPSAYRQWMKAPASTRPPEGETLDEAQQRLRKAMRQIMRRNKNDDILLVLRPVLMGLLKCLSLDQVLDNLWLHVDPAFRWSCYEVNERSL